MLDYAILFPYHRFDLLTWKHFNLVVEHNPGIPVIPLADGNTTKAGQLRLAGTVDVANLPCRWDTSNTWWYADTLLYRWWEHRTVTAKRYIYCEYDVLAGLSFPEFLADCWDAPLACTCFVTRQTRPNWQWFQTEFHLLPEEHKPFAAGTVPLALLLFSHEALDDITRNAAPHQLFCEFRLGTTANRLGIPVQEMANAQQTISWHSSFIKPQSQPSIYHPIKDPSLNYSVSKERLLETHDPYAALRFRDYRLLLAGGVLASIGAEIQAFTIGWELYQRTDSPAALGYTGLAQFLPVLLFALPAGQAADRFSRTRLYQAAQATAIVASLGLMLISLSQANPYLVYPCLLLAGTARAFSAPSRTSLLSQLVPMKTLSNAVTWNSTGWQIANVGGPPLGGFIIALSGKAAPAYLTTVWCSLTCLVLLGFIRAPSMRPSTTSRSVASLFAGVKFVWGSDLLLAAISLDLFAVLLGGATALLPVYAKKILEVGPVGLGWLRSAPALGALIMAFLLAHRAPMQRPGQALLLAVTGFGAATIVFGLSTDYRLSFVVLMLVGGLDNVSVVVRGTLMQMLTPDAMRGRVAAVNSVFISSSNELGAFESGQTAAWFGPVASVVGGGIGTIVVVVATMWRWPRLLNLGPLHQTTALQDTEQLPSGKEIGEEVNRSDL